MGIEVTEGTSKHLDAMWAHKKRVSALHKDGAFKLKRHQGKRKKMEEEIRVAEKKRRNQGWYNPGEGFNACLPIIDESVKLCRAGCGGTDHKTLQSRKCSFNTQNKRDAAQKIKEQESKEIEAIIQSQGNMM
jgi:hypothetical protein